LAGARRAAAGPPEASEAPEAAAPEADPQAGASRPEGVAAGTASGPSSEPHPAAGGSGAAQDLDDNAVSPSASVELASEGPLTDNTATQE
jgi:hypothetical protein